MQQDHVTRRDVKRGDIPFVPFSLDVGQGRQILAIIGLGRVMGHRLACGAMCTGNGFQAFSLGQRIQ